MATLNVGAGQAYATLSAAVAASRDGDVIAVQAGTYVNDFATISKDITIVGVGGMANFVATVAPPSGKGIFVTQGDVTIQNLSFSGAAVADMNGAGIRYEGGNLVVIDSYFHDNQMNLLATVVDPAGTIRIVGSEFGATRNSDSLNHSLYVGNIASLIVDDSYFHDANDGHQIKSRAQSTTITNSRIYDGTGAGSYTIDLPNGGVGVIRNNVIEQGPNSDNPFIIAYGEEGGVYAGSSLLIEGNVVVNDLSGSGGRLLYNAASVTGIVSNNAVYGLNAGQIAFGSATVSGTTFLSARPSLDTSPGGGTGGSPSGPLITAIETSGQTRLYDVGDAYHMYPANGAPVVLKVGGATLKEGQLGAWQPIGAEQVGGGYQVAWKLADVFWIWNADSGGNYVSNAAFLYGRQWALQSAETTFQQDLNGDHAVGPLITAIETSGQTRLYDVADAYFMYPASGAPVALKVGGAMLAEGQLGAWQPIGAEQVGGGYQVAWKLADNVWIWNVDSGGNYVSNIAYGNGSQWALQSAETTFRQDLNGDHAVGPLTTAIEGSGQTRLYDVADAYFMYPASGAPVALKVGGAMLAEGQLGAWQPIAAEQVGGGYQVAWKLADNIWIWNVDSGGNYVSNIAYGSGSQWAMQSAETTFRQDLNGDGAVGPMTTAIEGSGQTRLYDMADAYFLYPSSGASVALKVGGAMLAEGQLGAWKPIGAEKAGDGYQVVLQNGTANQYLIWDVDINGNERSSTAVISGDNPTLEALEGVFRQDLNHDSIIG